MRKKTRTSIARKLFPLLTSLLLAATALAGPPEGRFKDLGNGTIQDTRTGLTWAKNANLFGKGEWDFAVSSCASLSLGGQSGWRLPERDELVALALAIKQEKDFYGNPFTNMQLLHYWSATTVPDKKNDAYLVFMYQGYVYPDYKTVSYNVWPVHD